MDESELLHRAQTAEAKYNTLEGEMKSFKTRIQNFKANFGVKEKSDGTILIDFDKFTENLGLEGCLELRKIIDEKYRISGDPGEKPRVKVSAA